MRMGKKERSANLELLRIVSMVLIVMSHSDDWMGLTETYKTTVCINKFIADWLDMGGQIGVGCFLLISGYFMVDQPFRLKKIVRLLGEVWFYTISIWSIYAVGEIVTGTFRFSWVFVKYTLKSFCPVLFAQYWFVTAYIILMILSPFFNKLIAVMDKHMYQMLLVVLITIFGILDGGTGGILLNNMSKGKLIPVFMMYFIAGYIKKYVDYNKDNVKKHLFVAIIGYLLLYITDIGIGIIGAVLNSETIIGYYDIWHPLNSPVMLIINVELFLAFLRMKSIKSGIINPIASATFGVYLIHYNSIIMREVLPKIFPVYKETNSWRLLIYAIGSVLIVYIVCTLIDIVRQKTVHKLWIKLLDAKYNVWEENIKKQIAYVKGRIIKIVESYYGI